MKGDSVKDNDENIMKINDGIPFPLGSENEGMYFFNDSLNKNIPSKN